VGTTLRVERAAAGSLNAMLAGRTARLPVVTVTIVGIVSNAVSQPVVPAVPGHLYLPLSEVPDYVAAYARTNGTGGISAQIRDAMNRIDPDLPPVRIATLAARYDEKAGEFRLIARAASGLGAAALFLSVAGVYSVIAFFVSLRTHEFGIRLAIGARPQDITRLVVLQSSRLVATGLIVGMVLGIPVLILLSKAFRYTSAFDPVGLLVPIGALTLTALVAAGLPARRAARVDPCAALRSE
jgi:hypothetical protein